MSPVEMEKVVDCRRFRDLVHAFQAGEVPESLHVRLQEHLDGCPRCARYLEVENSFLDMLRARIPKGEAPAGLEARVLEALDREDSPVRWWTPAVWFRSPSFAVAATGVLLAALLVPGLAHHRGDAPALQDARAAVVHVTREARIVDLECDRAGRTIAQQRACRNSAHLNVLKLADGTYWNLSLDGRVARAIVRDPGQRGRRVRIVGDYYPAIHTVDVKEIRDILHASL